MPAHFSSASGDQHQQPLDLGGRPESQLFVGVQMALGD